MSRFGRNVDTGRLPASAGNLAPQCPANPGNGEVDGCVVRCRAVIKQVEIAEKLKPEFVTPLVLYLCSEQCPVSGRIYNAGMGFYGRTAIVSGPGTWLGDGELPTPEAVAANWPGIISLRGAQEYPDANAALMDMLSTWKKP